MSDASSKRPYGPPDAEARRRTLSSGVASKDCDAEPIHIPGGIQPHGFLLVLADDLRILQASENMSSLTGASVDTLPGKPLDAVLGAQGARRIEQAAASAALDDAPLYIGAIELTSAASFDVTLHRHDGALVVEMEAASATGDAFASMYPLVRTFARVLQDAPTVQALAELAVREVRAITGFGRVMLYSFDEEGRSHVLAEDRDASYVSFLHQFFPASDIPRQARALYLKNRIRLVADVNYRPARLVPAVNPVTGRPTDLTYTTLRSFSPVHLEYMRNMGTHASMSVSIVVRGQLWGLISCHDHDPRIVPFNTRVAVEHLGHMVSLQIEAKEERAEGEYLAALRRTMGRLIGAMGEHDDFVAGLQAVPQEVLSFARSAGAAIVFDDHVTLLGATPDEDTVRALTHWLAEHTSGVWATDSLARQWPPAKAHEDKACGVLAVPVSQIFRNYLLWFRPEVMQTIKWAGEPVKIEQSNGASAPRTSFLPWLETVRGHSASWRQGELEIAGELRGALLNIVLRRAEKRAELATELARANKELEAFSYSVSHDLRAPLRHIAGYGDLLREQEGERMSDKSRRFLNNMLDSARFAGTLVDDLLTFSQMGRAALRPAPVDLNLLVRGVVQEFEQDSGGRRIEWAIGDLPRVTGDAAFLQLALRNLISNAVKYTRTRESAKIEIFASRSGDEYVIGVRDNGVGFDMKYGAKLFGVFQRLHRAEEFEGTGIGLANVRRIVERHEGRTWAEGRLGEGAIFYFSLPVVFRNAGGAQGMSAMKPRRDHA
ncbi:histidine kinase [Burkholderia sp. SFA1]|uniref:ATP-binding protein n=1 Tax=unclassified Caballeronia TaxID=2646786 RepID=UPI0002387FC1|nr:MULTISPECIES: ATP-binding protein [unclassified Caballeronia]AET89343.1 multi-sensor signal transduction histidine kinase [Burkholderia sp. YI23]MCE4541606.1 ATP-binding protein [Caballeronia sp. PC1]MCE4569350.1 ATP-binding protein [Caballeronia sp. CLC5]BBP96503.1 histidine kinase [Burkholderia sp. SFA1]